MGATIEERYRAFEGLSERRSYRYRDRSWHYSRIGAGEHVVVFLPGGAGDGVLWFDQALGLRDEYTCVLMDYPIAASADELVDAVLIVLNAENVKAAHLIGTSLGGMVAMATARRAPERVQSMTLASTGVYGVEDVRRLRTGLRVVRNAPWWLVRWRLNQRMTRLLHLSPDRSFWVSRFDRTYVDPSQRARLISQQLVLLDFAERAKSPPRTEGWRTPVLMVAADDDTVIPPKASQRLLDSYRQHQIQRFSSGGHLLAATRPSEFEMVLRTFLTTST